MAFRQPASCDMPLGEELAKNAKKECGRSGAHTADEAPLGYAKALALAPRPADLVPQPAAPRPRHGPPATPPPLPPPPAAPPSCNVLRQRAACNPAAASSKVTQRPRGCHLHLPFGVHIDVIYYIHGQSIWIWRYFFCPPGT
jgi:hypothetical protein